MARRRLQTLGSDKTGWATTAWTDPGGDTGWCVMSVKPEVIADNLDIGKNIEHWSAGRTGNKNENMIASEMLEFYCMWDDAAIGIESFNLRQIAVELSPVTIRAKIEYGFWLMEKWEAEEDERPMGRGRYLFTQTPSMAKNTLSDGKMRELKLWTPGPDHPRDATKHCYTFLQRMQEKPKMRGIAWPHLFRKDGSLLTRRAPTSKATSRGRKS